MVSKKDISVLLVEDDENILKTLKVALKPLFTTIFTASNGSEALEVYKENHIDVIITDMNMPSVNGAELIETIRKIDLTLPVIVTTGYNGFEDTYKSLFNIFVYRKPVDVRTIYEVISSIEEDIVKIKKAKKSYEKLREASEQAKEILRLLRSDREH